MHQGDQDGKKGVYHINAVDSVTQYQVVATCEKISEAYLIPVLEEMLEAFPFLILGIHSDNGSEYINYKVAKLLEKLRIDLTKSRQDTQTTMPWRNRKMPPWSANTWDMPISPRTLPRRSTPSAGST
ncbi:integrase, catalytic region [mine drainage metagenome]|uniref:Integrase, catalytic region n=1 Tax=mine drainage metagenome TaxID=410659 RepID=T1BLU6_9ZZZZ